MFDALSLPCQRGRHIRCAGAVIAGPDHPTPGAAIGCLCACHNGWGKHPSTRTVRSVIALPLRWPRRKTS